MSGFFSLDAGIGFGKVQKNLQHHHHHQNQHQDQNQDQEHDDSIITPYSLYLFKNEEIYSKSFELWQCYQYQHHHHHQQQQEQQPNYGNKTMRQSGYGSIGNSGMNCQDCGNQAKKDCQHMRCRTCCKSRGFHCQTHVKSTWVPAAKRRERQQQLMSLSQNNISGNQQLSLMMRSATGGDETQTPKRLREDHHHHDHQRSITVAGNRTGGSLGVILPASQHHDTSSGLEVGNFPGEVSSPAVFRCVRVSGMDEAEEQLAYQTAVSIGGHVFKGILYDHGPEGRYHQSGEGSSSVAGSVAPLQQLNLITSGTTGVATETANINPAVSFIDPSSTYSTPFSAFMAGTQFFPPPRS